MVIIVLDILMSVWKLMGSPALLSPNNLRRLFRAVKQWWPKRRAAAAQRNAEIADLARREERLAAFSALEASVDKLHLMEQRRAEYHKVEWQRQILKCKCRTLRYLKLIGVRIRKDTYGTEPLPRQSENGTIIMACEPSEWHRGQVQLSLYLHPSSPLTQEEFIKFLFAHEPREHLKVFSRPLTNADMNAVGWEYPDRWTDAFNDD